MRVVCIDAEAWPVGFPAENNDGQIRNGETYEVTDVFFDEGYIWYEIDKDIGFGYWENAFARVSDVCETTFERNYKKELV